MALAALSGDEQCVIFSQLCNVLDTRIAVAFSSTSSELRAVTQAPRQQLQVLVAEIEKLEAEAAEHALAFQKVMIGERVADRSSSGRLRRLRRLRRQAEHAERERGRMHAELQSELGCGGKHTSLLATAVTTGTMCEDDVR